MRHGRKHAKLVGHYFFDACAGSHRSAERNGGWYEYGRICVEHIAEHLNDIPGVTTLSTAVAAANIDINNTTWLDSHGNPVAAVNWHVIGDGTIHF
jgi:hypothetical protein